MPPFMVEIQYICSLIIPASRSLSRKRIWRAYLAQIWIWCETHANSLLLYGGRLAEYYNMVRLPRCAQRKNIIFPGAEACRRIPSRGLNFHTPVMEFALDGTRNLKLQYAVDRRRSTPHAKFIECVARRV
jgi:hypothetical protein